MKRMIWAAAAAVCGLVIASCGGHGTPSAASYVSVQQVIAAMKRGRMPCTKVSSTISPVVAGAISEASCNFGATSNADL